MDFFNFRQEYRFQKINYSFLEGTANLIKMTVSPSY